MSKDLPQRLRHLAEQLVYGTVEVGAVSPGLLHSAADEIDRLRAPPSAAQRPRSSAGTEEPVNITGWKLVPDEPTEAMWQAGRSADIHPGDSYSKVWRAMFEAAPNVDDCETIGHSRQPNEAPAAPNLCNCLMCLAEGDSSPHRRRNSDSEC